MWSNEVKKYKDQDKGTVNGCCMFCGQMMTVEAPVIWGEDIINELVSEKCECDASQNWARRKFRKEKAHEKIKILFGDGADIPIDENAEKLLHLAADCIVDMDVEKMTIEIQDGTKGKISRTAKGFIKIERSESSRTGCEI